MGSTITLINLPFQEVVGPEPTIQHCLRTKEGVWTNQGQSKYIMIMAQHP